MTEFEWDERKEAENRRKHGVAFKVAQDIFNDPLVSSRRDLFAEEERWQSIGRVDGFPLLVVVHTTRYDRETEVIRIISARILQPREIRLYGRQNDPI